MLTILILLLGCGPATTNHTADSVDSVSPNDTHTVVDTDTNADDTGEEIVGGNCGGPEPPEDSLWDCDGGAGYGPAWPVTGGPTDLDECLTLDGWLYEMSSDGTSATLTRESDGRVITCELDE